MKILQESIGYISLLEKNEEWLIGCIIKDAGRAKLLKYFTNIYQHECLNVLQISKLLSKELSMVGYRFELADMSNSTGADFIHEYSLEQAAKAKSLGVSLDTFQKVLSLTRQAYISLIVGKCSHIEEQRNYLQFTEKCFQRMKQSAIEAWKFGLTEEISGELPDSVLNMEDANKYLLVFQSLFEPIFIFDDSQRQIILNPAAVKMLPGEQLDSILDPEQFSKKFKILHENIVIFNNSGLLENTVDIRVETPTGQKIFKTFLRRVIDVNKRFKGTVVVMQDLTEQSKNAENLKRAKQQAEEADKLKTAFLANMSHEIRTPMNAIIGFTELLLNESYATVDRKEYLKLIRSSSNDLLNIIEDIIDIAKLESNQLRVRYKACKIYSILDDLKAVTTETLRKHGSNNDVEVILKVDDSLKDLIIYTDGERLKQVLSNLLNNAAKFTNNGFIEFGFREVEKSNLFFFVRDSGTGIPNKMKDRIFERFFQLEKHIGMNLGGAGLGLAICKNIIQLLGGNIWLESTEGKGSDFYFQIPLRVVNPQKINSKEPEPEKRVNNCPELTGKKIIIAEDDEINYLFISELLNRTGADILWAKNGLEAINLAESTEKIDLILMDVKMPHVDGLEATKYITTVRPQIPIIAQTAFALEGDKNRCLQAGCIDYLTKPVSKEKLYALLKRYLQVSKTVQNNLSKSH